MIFTIPCQITLDVKDQATAKELAERVLRFASFLDVYRYSNYSYRVGHVVPGHFDPSKEKPPGAKS